MVRVFRYGGLIAFLPLVVFAAEDFRAPEPNPSDAPPAQVVDVPGLPRVLLIGDSITTGYSGTVRAKLAGKANVHRCQQNGGSTEHGMTSIEKWVGPGPWDVIHFNFGLHDLKLVDDKNGPATRETGHYAVTLEKYEQNLRALAARLGKTGAKLIFASITPVPANSTGRHEHDELAYNEVAIRVMRELKIPIDDLHAVAVARQAELQLPHNVHYTKPGYAELGTAAAASILPLLPPAKR